MATRKSYGNTWWGKKFLNALQQIDYSNRLPRGKTYANKGAVREIQIDGAVVEAKVKGSRPRPYTQTIRIQPFSDKAKQQIVRTLLDNPFVLSQLLNRELPPGVADELQAAGFSVFPERWRDVQAHCSCPDIAVPCKHLAAVIYLLANEVDKNPFLVFQLRGLDLLGELEKAGMTATGAMKAHVPKLSDALHQEPMEGNALEVDDALRSIDFSRIPHSREKLFKLLPEKPAFYPKGDFKKVLEQWYKALGKSAAKFAYEASTTTERLPYNLEAFSLHVDAGDLSLTEIVTTIAGEEANTTQVHKGRFLPLEPFLYEKQQGEVDRQIGRTRLLWATWELVLQLATKSAIVPQVMHTPKDQMCLRWLPAMVDPQVKAIVERLAAAFPPDLVRIKGKGNKTHFLTQQEQLFFLFNALLYWLLDATDSVEAYPDGPVQDLFFGTQIFESQDFGDEEIPYVIQQWVQRFYLAERDLVPVLHIEEDEPDFLLSFDILDKTQKLSLLVPLQDFFVEEDYNDKRLGVLQDLASLAEYLPDVQQIVKSKGTQKARLDSQSFVRVLMDTLPALELMGIQVLLPKALQKIVRPQASLNVDSFENPDAAVGYLNLKDMFSFQWKVALGELVLDAEVFLEEVARLRGLVKIQDQYVLVDEKDMQQLLKKLADPPQLGGQEVLQAALSERYKDSPVRLSRRAKKIIQQLVELESVPPPIGLLATFRPYQHRGYSWLYKNHRIGFGSILADDMGLGKTLQVIAFLTKLEQEGELFKRTALAVVPTPLISNWQRECQKFAPGLRVGIFHGPDRKLSPKDHDVIITSYGVARSDEKLLAKTKWRVLIIDEAQAIKNPGTAQTKALKKFKADTRIAMSGTPVENRMSEYWSIFDFTNKGYLSNLNRFKKEYMVPIEKDRDQEKLQIFRQVTAPFILRRLKTDKSIISDLPDKIEQDHYCTLSAEQTALYQGVVDTNLEQIEENEGIARAGLIFKLMTALKQICNHPSLYLKNDDPDPALSGKAALLINLLSQIRAQGEKVLIFTQYKTMGDLLVRLLSQQFPEAPLFLHGSLSRKQRDHLVDTFQTQPFAWAFILSLKAAGTGLNLTAANHVIHYDLWWNPAVEAQATDRAFRIGQQKNVQVNRFITQGTFEEKINAMIQKKRELADLTVGSGEQWIGDLSNQELKTVFKLANEGE